MLKLNNKGFAISAILYTLLILTVLLMFLILSIQANRRATINKILDKTRQDVSVEMPSGEEVPSVTYLLDIIKSQSKGNDSLINYGRVSSATNGNGVYVMASTETDEYPIYFYRGDIDNNYLLFAGSCWQIVRTTNTGGIKLIYVNKGTTCKFDKNSVISEGKVKYSSTKSTYRYASSTVKTTVESWYNNNIASEYRTHVKSEKWCNDTISNPATRVLNVNSCSNPVTAYIGLPTYDEIVLAGGVYDEDGIHRDYFLYIPQNYKLSNGSFSDGGSSLNNITTLSMSIHTAGSASTVYYIGSNGQLDQYTVTYTYNIRPMIVIAEKAKYVSGDGSISSPYQIEW